VVTPFRVRLDSGGKSPIGTLIGCGNARMTGAILRPSTAFLGRILGIWARACQLKGLPVSSASIAREAETAGSVARKPRRADKTVAGREKNRLCCPPDRANRDHHG
jgi:hypothetical protein